MANFMAETLEIKNVYVLDDSGAYGVGLADAYQAQADEKGVKILGRDRLDPKASDYTAILTKIKALRPAAIYYGGVGQAGTSWRSRPMIPCRASSRPAATVSMALRS